jgi:carboxymethylenebutenolidase
MLSLRSAHDGHLLPVSHVPARQPRRGAVVLLQEIFGVDAFIRGQARHWASAGYEVLAPALFDRCAPGFEAAHDPAGIERGFACVRSTPDAQALDDVRACVAYAAAHGPVHVLGFCYGGRLAWRAAAQGWGIHSAVVFYGNVLAHVADRPKCPVMLHFGELDAHLPVAQIARELPQTSPMALLHLYPESGHGFVNEASTADRAAAALALRRSTSFLDAVS